MGPIIFQDHTAFRSKPIRVDWPGDFISTSFHVVVFFSHSAKGKHLLMKRCGCDTVQKDRRIYEKMCFCYSVQKDNRINGKMCFRRTVQKENEKMCFKEKRIGKKMCFL